MLCTDVHAELPLKNTSQILGDVLHYLNKRAFSWKGKHSNVRGLFSAGRVPWPQIDAAHGWS